MAGGGGTSVDVPIHNPGNSIWIRNACKNEAAVFLALPRPHLQSYPRPLKVVARARALRCPPNGTGERPPRTAHDRRPRPNPRRPISLGTRPPRVGTQGGRL